VIAKRFSRRGIGDLLQKYGGLRLRPTPDGTLRISGTLGFAAQPAGQKLISDSYEIDISVPATYPRAIPLVRETATRIPKDFHKLGTGHLCLGSPTRIRLILAENPSLVSFVERCVIPYLYGYSIAEAGGGLPFGELQHGSQGLRDDLASLLGIDDDHTLFDFVLLLAMKKRRANKLPCPCGSSLRLGKCHNRRLNMLRYRLGRRWFASLISRRT
jgi:hypothetical protein